MKVVVTTAIKDGMTEYHYFHGASIIDDLLELAAQLLPRYFTTEKYA